MFLLIFLSHTLFAACPKFEPSQTWTCGGKRYQIQLTHDQKTKDTRITISPPPKSKNFGGFLLDDNLVPTQDMIQILRSIYKSEAKGRMPRVFLELDRLGGGDSQTHKSLAKSIFNSCFFLSPKAGSFPVSSFEDIDTSKGQKCAVETHVKTKCGSACVCLFAAAATGQKARGNLRAEPPKRLMNRDAKLLTHQTVLFPGSGIPIPGMSQSDLEECGFNKAWLQKHPELFEKLKFEEVGIEKLECEEVKAEVVSHTKQNVSSAGGFQTAVEQQVAYFCAELSAIGPAGRR